MTTTLGDLPTIEDLQNKIPKNGAPEITVSRVFKQQPNNELNPGQLQTVVLMDCADLDSTIIEVDVGENSAPIMKIRYVHDNPIFMVQV